MDRGIVKLNALPNADRPRTEHDHTRFARVVFLQKRLRFVLFAGIVRVEIRRLRLKLCRTGIDHSIARIKVFLNWLPTDPREHAVGIAKLFSFPIRIFGQSAGNERLLEFDQMLKLCQKPDIDHRDRVDFVHLDATLERFKDHKQPLVVAIVQQRVDLLVRLAGELCHVQAVL